MPEPVTPLQTPTPTARRPLVIQASIDQLELTVQLHNVYGFDVVLTASSDPRRDPYAALEAASRYFTEQTGSHAQLDANRYAGPNRKFGASELNLEWARAQLRLGTPMAITDAGYIEDISQIPEALAHAEAVQGDVDGPVLATIAIPAPMLRNHREELVDLLGSSSVSVGLALGHAKDPLASPRAVAALIELLALGTVHSRRIDLSGIGGLAFGAQTAAIGTNATLRHIYPPTGGGGATSAWWSTLVPGTMSWRTHDRVMDAASTFSDHRFWECECGHCAGRSIASTIRSAEDATAHNFATIDMLAKRVLSSPDPRLTWIEMCRHAQTYAFEVMAASGPGWEPQDYLGAWVANRPIPVAS